MSVYDARNFFIRIELSDSGESVHWAMRRKWTLSPLPDSWLVRDSESARANVHARRCAHAVGLSAQSGARSHVPRRHARRG